MAGLNMEFLVTFWESALAGKQRFPYNDPKELAF